MRRSSRHALNNPFFLAQEALAILKRIFSYTSTRGFSVRSLFQAFAMKKSRDLELDKPKGLRTSSVIPSRDALGKAGKGLTYLGCFAGFLLVTMNQARITFVSAWTQWTNALPSRSRSWWTETRRWESSSSGRTTGKGYNGTSCQNSTFFPNRFLKISLCSPVARHGDLLLVALLPRRAMVRKHFKVHIRRAHSHL